MLRYSFLYRSSFSDVKLFFSLMGPHKHRSELLGNKAKLLLRKTTMKECMLMIKKCRGSANLNYSLLSKLDKLHKKLYLDPPNLLYLFAMLD